MNMRFSIPRSVCRQISILQDTLLLQKMQRQCRKTHVHSWRLPMWEPTNQTPYHRSAHFTAPSNGPASRICASSDAAHAVQKNASKAIGKHTCYAAQPRWYPSYPKRSWHEQFFTSFHLANAQCLQREADKHAMQINLTWYLSYPKRGLHEHAMTVLIKLKMLVFHSILFPPN